MEKIEFRYPIEDDEVTNLSVEEGIESIPFRACYERNSLEKVTLPRTITQIADSAFKYCSKLAEINLPEGLTSLGDGVFSRCVNLKKIKLPQTLKSIGRYAFSHCERLESIEIPNQVTSINDCIFIDCHSLQSIKLPDSIETIGCGAFWDCQQLETFDVPELVIKINDNTFRDCYKLQSVSLSDKVKTIGDKAFKCCVSLKELKNLSSDTSIHESSFEGCIKFQMDSPNIPRQLSDSIKENQENPWSTSSFEKRREKVVKGLKKGAGSNKNIYCGKTQKGYTPEYWSVTDEQLKLIKKHPLFDRIDETGKYNFTMREFVSMDIEPGTKDLEVGIGLLFSEGDPEKAVVMVSHCWDEPVPEFVIALENSGEKGPYWVCALALHQNQNEQSGLTIQQQLGKDVNLSPFACVLKSESVNTMVSIITHTCDIYTRLWCVYEMYVAVQNDVKVILCPYGGGNKENGLFIGDDICIQNADKKVDSSKASCGPPGSIMNEDEKSIRREIDKSGNSGEGFLAVDEAVEMIRLLYLLKYPTMEIKFFKTIGRKKIQRAIESILLRLPAKEKMLNFNNFLERELNSRPSFKKVPDGWNKEMDGSYNIGDHDYYIFDEEKSEEKLDVFKMWINNLEDILTDWMKEMEHKQAKCYYSY